MPVEKLLWEGEGEEVIALLGVEFAVAACGDNEVLFAIEGVGHGRGLAAGGKFVLPEFLAGVGIEGAEIVVHCCGGED